MKGSALALLRSSAFALALVTSADAFAQAPSGPAPAAAPTTPAAGHFRRGVELYDEGDHAAALIEFKRAYETAPDFRVLYNIGQTQYELRDYAGASRAFRQYLTDGGDRVPEARREQVEADLARLGQRVARVRPRVDVDGAAIAIDGAPMGTSPLKAPILVNLGRHEVRASHRGRTMSRTIEVAGGDDVEVPLALPQDDDASSQRSTPGSARKTLGIVLAATGGAVLVGALVTDLALVPRAIDDFETKRDRDDPAAKDAQSSINTLQTVSLVGYGAGLVLGGLGVALVLWPEKPATARTVTAGVGGNSVWATVRF